MKIDFKKGSHGNALIVVTFEDSSNFDPKDLTWVPKLEELDKIQRAVEAAGKLTEALK